MRISYLLIVFGDTGGSLVIYQFMDKLCERGHDVFAVTPGERIKWEPGYSKILMRRFKPSWKAHFTPRRIAGRIISPARKLLRAVSSKTKSELLQTADIAAKAVQGLLTHWPTCDRTISTQCITAYANYFLMDKTVPVYHMQHYEEVWMPGAASQKMARLTYYLPLVLTANSTWLQNQIRNRMSRESYLLNPGINLALFSPSSGISEKYRGPGKRTVVSYYSPVKFKAWDDAVSAMKIVFKKTPKNKVEWIVFGGEPPVKPDLPVKFVGKIFGKSLAALYSNAHLVFMNSWVESFPLPPLEAMACGTAVVTTCFGTEDYAFDGRNSLVIPPKKPELLADAILKLLENPGLAQDFALEGVATAGKFSWENAADRLEEILEQAPSQAFGEKFSDL